MSFNLTFLDQYAPAIHDLVDQHVPDGVGVTRAAGIERAAQLEAVRDADVVFTGWCPVDADLIDAAPRLRLVHKLGAGVDKIDVSACRRRGIAVARLAGANAVPVAEHVVLLMLATLRRLPFVDARTRAGAWMKEEARGVNRQLQGKRVGLVGLGQVGRAVAERLHGFGVELVYHDPVRLDAGEEAALGLAHLELEELLATSDVVSLHVPLLPATRGLIDAAALAGMKPHAVLVNCGRGGLVDEEALDVALRSGRLLGAGLDVFATEPPAGSPLLTLPNTVVTPHLAGATLDNFAAVLERALANARSVLAGRPLPAADAVLDPAGAAVPG